MFLIFFAVFMDFSKFRLRLYRMAEENDTDAPGRNTILQASILRKMLTSLCQYDSLYMWQSAFSKRKHQPGGLDMKRRRLSFTTRYVLVVGLLMLIANIILGIAVLFQTESTLRGLINKDMLDVARTAADLLDGDTLTSLTEADVDGEVYRDIENKLIVFQNHEEIRYIYAVKKTDDGRFIFTVDPDPVEPGVFGEEIVVSDALIQAGSGTAAVDLAPVKDRWGNYYSAYCPVFGSDGSVAGIVGVDFDADWYNKEIIQHTVIIAIISLLSVLVGGVVVFIISHNVRKRFTDLHAELSSLSSGLDQLITEAGGVSERTAQTESESAEDEIGRLSDKIQMMQKDIAFYEHIQKEQYYRDAVTGTPNLVYLKQFADDKLDGLWAAGETPAIYYFDIRSMVSYNTEYGYPRGDALLKLTSDTIVSAFPEALAGRGEGDHFIVIDKYDDTIEQKALQINDTVKREAYGRTTGIQCAIVIMQQGMKAADGVQCARNTLKKIGSDLNIVSQVHSYEDDKDILTGSIVRSFDEALQNGWIKVFYHPILDTGTGKVSVFEGLARWIDPKEGMISPGQFIPVLSRYHLLHKLDLYMVEKICQEVRVRDEAGLPRIPVSVNFSAQDFDYINVAEALNRILEKYSLPKSSIIVEITEQDLAQATDHFMEQLRRIHDTGYQLWLDDFGSGYSSLNVFGRYPVDRIKFDMDLVRHLDDNDGANRVIMKHVVQMCREIDVHTLAEGVETREQDQFLKEIHCELEQGFLFFRPEPVEKVVSSIQSFYGNQ